LRVDPIKLQEGFFVAYLYISLLGGAGLGLSLISAISLWAVCGPGLYKTEKGAFLPFLISSPLMVLFGRVLWRLRRNALAFDSSLVFQAGAYACGEGTDNAGGIGRSPFRARAGNNLA